jgi:hypothetical protein
MTAETFLLLLLICLVTILFFNILNFILRKNKVKDRKKINKLTNNVAEAMASKIKFESSQHRKK